jgi:hypothetical protein
VGRQHQQQEEQPAGQQWSSVRDAKQHKEELLQNRMQPEDIMGWLLAPP